MKNVFRISIALIFVLSSNLGIKAGVKRNLQCLISPKKYSCTVQEILTARKARNKGLLIGGGALALYGAGVTGMALKMKYDAATPEGRVRAKFAQLNQKTTKGWMQLNTAIELAAQEEDKDDRREAFEEIEAKIDTLLKAQN